MHATFKRDDAKASVAFSELIAAWRETEDRKDVTPGLVSASTFYADRCDATQLSVCLDILNTIQDGSEALEPGYVFLAASGEEAWSRGRPSLAVEHFTAAATGFASLKLPLEECWTKWRLGVVAHAMDDAETARRALLQAEEIASRLGARPLGQAIRHALAALSPSQNSLDSPLTRRQLEIVRLLATGMTNKEAAVSLGISPRTVEMHVAALLERLRCRSRAEAVSKVSELGLLIQGWGLKDEPERGLGCVRRLLSLA